MSNLAFAVHVGVSVRSVAGWHQKPGRVLAQGTVELLEGTLERACEQAKARFAALVSEVSGHDGDADQPGQEPASRYGGDDAGCLAEGPGWLPEVDRSVSLLDGLAVADPGRRPGRGGRVDAGGDAGADHGVLVLRAGMAGQPGRDPRPQRGVATAEWIRAFTHSLMDLDVHYGGGHVRQALLSFFRSEIVPLLRGRHPQPVRRELFSAAAETAEMLGFSAYDAGRHGAAQRYFAQGLRLAGEAADPVLGARLMSSLSHQANYLGQFGDALQLARAAQWAAAGRATPAVLSMFLAMEARALATATAKSRSLVKRGTARAETARPPTSAQRTPIAFKSETAARSADSTDATAPFRQGQA